MNSFFKKFVVNVFNNFGYSIIPSWRLENYALAQHLKKLFNHHSITAVFDVGANVGQYHDFIRREVAFSGRVISFEPQPNLAALLNSRLSKDSCWDIHNIGLGSSNAELKLNVMARDTFSSFRNPASNISRQFISSNTVVEEVVVPVRRLDDVFSPDFVKENSCYLKIDTQGFDLEVLIGAGDLLSHFKALQFELAIDRLYEGVPDYKEMLATVEGMGFQVSGLFPISMDENMQAIEFDCVMVRSDKSTKLQRK